MLAERQRKRQEARKAHNLQKLKKARKPSTQNLQKRMAHRQHLNFSSMRPKFRFLTYTIK